MRSVVVGLFSLLVLGCGNNVQRSSPPPPAVLTIPVGAGEWVIAEREIALESLTTGRLVLPYGPGSAGRALKQDSAEGDPKRVIRYQIVFAADPLAPGDRCALSMTHFQVVHADGSITEAPAEGHVVDNSDNKVGLRATLSPSDRKQLVIPNGATATTHFTKSVSVSTR